MKKVFTYVVIAIALSTSLYFIIRSQSSEGRTHRRDNSRPLRDQVGTQARPGDDASKNNNSDSFKLFMHALTNEFEKVGAKRYSSPAEYLNSALNSQNQSEVLPAVIYVLHKSPWTQSSAISAVEKIINKVSPWLKLCIAEELYEVGARSARTTLTELVNSSNPILIASDQASGKSFDLRFSAARIIGKYRDYEARQAVVDLYRKTKSRELLDSLAKLRVDEAGSIIEITMGAKKTSKLFEYYGLLNYGPGIELASESLGNPKASMSVRLAAAWALAKTRRDPKALSYIHDFVSAELLPDAEIRGIDERQMIYTVIKYLGALQDDRSKDLLEKIASKNTDQIVTEHAIANLALSYPNQSLVARQMIINRLTTTTNKISYRLSIQIGARMNDDEINKAGEASDEISGGDQWKRETTGIANRPIWSWADQYLL
jgi:hypothetical protein